MVRALINTIFARETPAAASKQWRVVADQLREKFPKLATLMNDVETGGLNFMSFPSAHLTQIHSTNSLERLNAEVNPGHQHGVYLSCPGIGHEPAKFRTALLGSRDSSVLAALYYL
jgi:hypothetical protein